MQCRRSQKLAPRGHQLLVSPTEPCRHVVRELGAREAATGERICDRFEQRAGALRRQVVLAEPFARLPERLGPTYRGRPEWQLVRGHEVKRPADAPGLDERAPFVELAPHVGDGRSTDSAADPDLSSGEHLRLDEPDVPHDVDDSGARSGIEQVAAGKTSRDHLPPRQLEHELFSVVRARTHPLGLRPAPLLLQPPLDRRPSTASSPAACAERAAPRVAVRRAAPAPARDSAAGSARPARPSAEPARDAPRLAVSEPRSAPRSARRRRGPRRASRSSARAVRRARSNATCGSRPPRGAARPFS